MMFEKLLVANRGEIACRIIRSAQAMGIHCTAIYSEADSNSLATRLADNAICVGAAKAKDSYLNITRIIEAAVSLNIDAIHPGYGFLSENVEFARACEKAGIIFVGPSIDALHKMASKQLAKQILEDSNVPLTPGYHGENQEESWLFEKAKAIGFPVLLKAAMGGGGKGMREVHSAKEFSAALAGAKREAMASFGNDHMIIEKLVLHPRHVEVQIMADNFGNVVHLFERDCSIQRRHQKIIEEAPAPNLKDNLRKKMHAAAIDVAKKIDYRGAGTIEFLLAPNDEFYFMEMNTRLQVEHPVSEMITGQDFVAWQLKIAAGEPLPLLQEDITAQGHAIECRIYAEDPKTGFLPSCGTLQYLHSPTGPGIRVDSGVVQGDTISQYYDPMIAKLISHGDTRAECILRLQRALKDYHIEGVKHNIPFLSALCTQASFKEAQLHTAYLEEHPPQLSDIPVATAIIFYACHYFASLLQQTTDSLIHDTFAWQNAQSSFWWLIIEIDNNRYQCRMKPRGFMEFTLYWDENIQHISFRKQAQQYSINTEQGEDKATIISQEDDILLFHSLGQLKAKYIINPYDSGTQDANADTLAAPMPATVVAVLKTKGERIKRGEALIVLEAMKMEHTICAPQDGVIDEIFFAVGAQVNEGVQLLALKDSSMETV